MSRASQDLIERGHGVDSVVLEHVRVDPLGDDRVVPHDSGHRYDRDAGREEQADRGASAVMRPDPSQSGFSREALEVGAVCVREACYPLSKCPGSRPKAGSTCLGDHRRTLTTRDLVLALPSSSQLEQEGDEAEREWKQHE